MTIVVGLLAGFVAVSLLLRTTRPLLEHPGLQRENVRGRAVPTAVGAVLVLAFLAVESARTLLAIAGAGDVRSAPHLLVLVAVLGFGFLGLVDDLLGDGGARGLRGHVAALGRGVVTTGFLKLAGGAGFAVVLAGTIDPAPRWQVVVDGAVIALAANLGNLFDRAPGRTVKWTLVVYVPLALVAGTTHTGVALAVLAGVAAGFLPGDLRERYMLGDTGANALGAGLGVGAVLALGQSARVVTALVLLALTLASEVVSFSRVIAATPPLRAFDRAGRMPEEDGA